MVCGRRADRLYIRSWFGVGTCGPTPMLDSIAIAVQKATQPSLVFGGDLRRNIYLTAE